MRTTVLILALSLLFLRTGAQCNLTPTINPASPILCPNTSDTLWTQIYDSYQWYKNGNLISGATNQYLVVDAFNDGGSNFTVAVTDDTCSATSGAVLVDGWVFLLPYVINSGDQGWINGMGVQNNCFGDTVILELGTPYDTLIQWFNNNVPIPGANNDTLIVTQSGNYTVEGAPLICPGFVQQLGVTITIVFTGPAVPTIGYNGAQLVCTASGTLTYQWFLNGNPISGANASVYTPTQNGQYTCQVTDVNGCTAMSQPDNIVLGLTETNFNYILNVYPNPAAEQLNIQLTADVPVSFVQIVDISGRLIQQERVTGQNKIISVSVKNLETGNYFVQLLGEDHQQMSIKPFTKMSLN